MTTPVSSMVLVSLAAFVGSFGAVFLKSGAHRVRHRWQALLFNWRLAAGVALFVFSSIFFVLGVRRGELSVLYPMVSVSYIWTLLWSRVFFKELLTRNKFLGLCLILTGIAIIGLAGR